jgi:tol-pal system protein YbgF
MAQRWRRLHPGSRATAALLLFSLLVSCTVVTQEQVDQQARRTDALQERVLRLERALEEEQRPAPASALAPDLAGRLAELGQIVQALEEELRALTGKVDALAKAPPPAPAAGADSPRLTALEERIRGLADRLAALEASTLAPTRAAPPPQGAVPTPLPTPSPAVPKTSPQDLYDQAYATYKRGAYEEAREAFNEYIRLHPDTNLTDNAYFWIGESFYEQQKFEQAILEYDKVVQKFPTGDKVASALLKQAFAFDAIGDPTDAKILLKKILREHPSSEQAAIARKKLEILGD